MLRAMDAELLVTPCPAKLRPDALRKLHAGLPLEQRDGFAEALAKCTPHDEAAWEGLLAAVASTAHGGEHRIKGAVWVQPTPGNTAVVWPPPASFSGADDLLAAAADVCDRREIGLAQMVVAEHDGYSRRRLESCGFTKVADLVYLFAQLVGQKDSQARVQDDVSFIPSAGDQSARFAAMVEDTYQGTQDCPALDGVRPIADVLAGYRAQGRYHPEHWYLVQSSRADVGVLILAAHPASQNWELVYMGVSPQARGMGLGQQIVQFALDQAARAGGERLVLAVDAANVPALAVYRAAGLVEWDRRTVFARMRRP